MTIKTLVAVLLLSSLALPASAASLYGDMSGTTTINVGAGAGPGAEATTSPPQADAEDTVTSDTDVSTRIELRANDRGVVITGSGQVATDADLEVYRENLRVEDTAFVDATLDGEDTVDVAYYHDGKLFGLIPVKVKSSTSVTTGSNGEVVIKTRMPWWNIFVTGTNTTAADIDETLTTSSMIESDFKLGVDAAARARILEAIANAHAQARVTAAGN